MEKESQTVRAYVLHKFVPEFVSVLVFFATTFSIYVMSPPKADMRPIFGILSIVQGCLLAFIIAKLARTIYRKSRPYESNE